MTSSAISKVTTEVNQVDFIFFTADFNTDSKAMSELRGPKMSTSQAAVTVLSHHVLPHNGRDSSHY